MVIIYLASRLLGRSSELLITRLNFMNEILAGFVLAPGKDLAVSLSHYCETSRGKRARNPFGIPASLFAPRALLRTAVSRYPQGCSDFPPFTTTGGGDHPAY